MSKLRPKNLEGHPVILTSERSDCQHLTQGSRGVKSARADKLEGSRRLRKNFAKGLLPFWPRMRALYEPAKKKSILSQGSGRYPAHPGGDALWYRRPELNWYSLGPGDFKSPVSTDSTTAAKISSVLANGDFFSLGQELTKPFLLAKNAVPKKVTATVQGERA